MRKIKEKLKQIEQSDSFGLFVLFGLVITIGVFAFYQDYKSLDERKEIENNYKLIKKAKVTEIVPVEHLSMFFDGNKVLTLGYRISYEYQLNNEMVRSTDVIKNRETKLTVRNKIENLKINDSIYIKVNNENFRESIVYIRP